MFDLNISVSNLCFKKTGDNNQALESEVEYELTSKKAHHHSLNKT